jgi:hypothetical protein
LWKHHVNLLLQSLNKSHIISTDEDPGLRIESFAVINLRGVSTNKTIICFIAMQTYKELIFNSVWWMLRTKQLNLINLGKEQTFSRKGGSW